MAKKLLINEVLEYLLAIQGVGGGGGVGGDGVEYAHNSTSIIFTLLVTKRA